MSRRFAIGEVCIVADTVGKNARHLVGTECEVIEYGWFGRNEPCQYTVRCVDGIDWGAREYHLRKKDQHGDKDKLIRQETVPWHKTPFVPKEVQERMGVSEEYLRSVWYDIMNSDLKGETLWQSERE